MTLSNRLQNLILGAIGDLEASNELINAIQSGENGVSSLNTLSGALSLVAGTNISLSPSGSNITINSTATSNPAGSNGNVQFNSSGSFGANTKLQWDNTNFRLGINQPTPVARIHANSATTSGTVGADAIILGVVGSTSNVGQGAVILNGTESGNIAPGQDSIAVGGGTNASGISSFAGGFGAASSGNLSFAFGNSAVASGLASHAEGAVTLASGGSSHAEGTNTTASGASSHAEGSSTARNINGIASGASAHSEGINCNATASASHAQGNFTVASGVNSFSAGLGTLAQGFNQTAIGQYNVGQGTGTSFVSTDQVLIVGNGTNSGSLHTSLAILNNGTVQLFDSTTNTIGISAPSSVTSYALVLPAAQGAASSILQNDGSGNLSWVNAPMVFTSSAGSGGSATQAMTVTGLLSTDTILSVSQMTPGANSLPLIGYSTLANNSLTAIWASDPGAGSVIVVTVAR